MKDYEGMFIIKPDLDQTKSQNLSKDIEKVITSNKGVVKNSSIWGKRQLAYKIGKYKEGIYQLIHFQTEPTEITKLKRGYLL
jgi:small subunit ribosomal protein S6